MSLRVLIADDHEVVRTGLKILLSNSDIKVVGEAATGEAAVRMALKNEADVVLIDVRMPDGDGLVALERIKTERPDLPILLLSGYDNPTYVARAVALGACGYILKGAGRERLIEAIQAAARGDSTWTRDELRKVTGALATSKTDTDVEATLTHRESEVLRQLSHGLTNKEIASTLNISYETVKEHVQHILRKIGVSDRTQAAVWAVRRGLV